MKPAGSSWARRYPPLAVIAAAVILAVFTLPSALNLPQANPGQLAEYAPVPGNGNSQPQGNLAALGLGEGGAANGGAGQPAPVGGGGTMVPSSYNCVGDPPRQTEDPLSPPCVAFFHGDNGGSTWRGVSQHEITLLIYHQGAATWAVHSGNGTEPSNTLVDLNAAPQPNEFEGITDLRNWVRYFNSRYQTYGRRVHGYVYFNDGSGSSQSQLADAAANQSALHPFAEVNSNEAAKGGTYLPYLDAMAGAGTLNFGSSQLLPESEYQRYPGFIWSFKPSLEQVAASYSAFVCTKVAPYPVSFSGNSGMIGKPRVYGFLSTTDGSSPELVTLAGLVKHKVEGCGIRFVKSDTYPNVFCGLSQGGNQQAATSNMADFNSAGVTTIIWPGGCESQQSNTAEAMGYLPEWVVADASDGFAGDAQNDFQGQAAWSHAWVVTPDTYRNADGVPAEPPCADAYRSVAPQADSIDVAFACDFYYDDLRQVFTGIQVAGPHLTPGNIDAGFHAIPPNPSSGPTEPACFYDPGDYTCVKDAMAEWWDPTAGAGSQGGCYRMGDHGRRYLRGGWPAGDVMSMHQADDPCNLYGVYGYN